MIKMYSLFSVHFYFKRGYLDITISSELWEDFKKQSATKCGTKDKKGFLLTAVVILKGAGAALRGMQRTMNDILQIVGGKLGGVLNIISM